MQSIDYPRVELSSIVSRVFSVGNIGREEGRRIVMAGLARRTCTLSDLGSWTSAHAPFGVPPAHSGGKPAKPFLTDVMKDAGQ
jgi:hypothetical protein